MESKMLVYSQKDVQAVMDYINGLVFKGVAEARKLSTMATILESGKPLVDYLNAKGSDKDGTTEQDEQGGDSAD